MINCKEQGRKSHWHISKLEARKRKPPLQMGIYLVAVVIQ
jgi:hypothetical protein